MKQLSYEEIKALIVGASEIVPVEDGLAPAKCSSRQLEAFRAAAPWIVDNVKATTGVRIDFVTDSPTLAFGTAAGDKFELLVDGVLAKQFLGADARSFEIKGLEGEHRITLAFPSHMTPGVLSSVSVEDGARVSRPRYEKKLLFLGDSITQGWNARYDSQSFAYIVSRHLGAESLIQGVGGACFWPDTVPFREEVGFDPDAVVVAYGTNDWSIIPSFETFRENLAGVLLNVKTRFPASKLFVVTPIWREDEGGDRPMGPWDRCRGAVHDAAKSMFLCVVDGYSLVPHDMFFMADALHPNDLGFAHYALGLIKEMEK